MLKDIISKVYAPNAKINVKSFNEIPTLRSFPFIGHSYLFRPGGKYSSERLTEAVVNISTKLGRIFTLKLGGGRMVVTTDADNAKILFANEGSMPNRPTFPALAYYRKHTLGGIGVVPGNGIEWYKYRKGVTDLLKTQMIEYYTIPQKEAVKNFVTFIEQNRNSNFVLTDIYTHLLKYSIEAISVISPGYHIKCVLDNNTLTNDIIKASTDFMDGLYRTLKEPPLWKLWKSEGYKKLESSHQIVHRIVKLYLKQLKAQYDKDPKSVQTTNPYIYSLLTNKNLTWNDIIILCIEVFFGGIDATATTIAFTLYYLAKNPEIQETARNTSSPSSEEFLNRCVQETLRLSPTAGANARYLINDTIMNGYLIPKGTLVSVFNSVCSRDEKYFSEPDKYNPHRWMRSTQEDYHRFASLPFGHGPRMCPGRRAAMHEIVTLLKEILRNYKLECVNDEEVGMVYRMNRIPDKTIDIKFLSINH